MRRLIYVIVPLIAILCFWQNKNGNEVNIEYAKEIAPNDEQVISVQESLKNLKASIKNAKDFENAIKEGFPTPKGLAYEISESERTIAIGERFLMVVRDERIRLGLKPL